MDIFNQLDIQQLVVAALTLSAAGIVGFWVKDFPIKVFEFFKRQFTTTLDITSAHKIFYNLMKFMEDNYKEKNFRNFKLTNGKWGNSEITTMGIGYGGHFIRFRKMFLHINLERHDSQGTEIDKETITVTKLGRNRNGFDEFFKTITVDKEKENTIEVYKMSDYWEQINQIPKRKLETVFLENEKKDILLKTIDNFISEEQWYLDNGIPYHLGILLYGNPGTGKSSLIKAIASYVNYDIYYLSVQRLHKIEDSMSGLPKNSILVIEDIDCEKALHNREPNEESSRRSKKSSVVSKVGVSSGGGDLFSLVNFSDVLNAIDGICSSHGRILITTTNHIEKLDPALIRPGRIDLQVEVGHVNLEIFNQFADRFFGKTLSSTTMFKDNLTCAELQNFLLQKKSFEEIVEMATVKD